MTDTIDGKRGRFWLPTTPERVVSGLLRASVGNIELELEDSLASVPATPSLLQRDPLEHAVILGAVDGVPVTLETTYGDRSWRWDRFGHHVQERYNAMRAVKNAHLDRIVLSEALVEFDTLDIWAPPPRIETTDSGDIEPRIVQATYREPQALVANLPSGTVELGWPAAWSVGDDFQLTPHARFLIRPALSMDLKELADSFIAPLRALVTLGLHAPSVVRSVSGIPDQTHVTGNRLGPYVDVFYLPTGEPAEVRPNRYYAPFVLAAIRERFADVLQAWLVVWSQLRTVCDLYFASVESRPLHREVRFLLSCQAVELLHSLRREPLRRPKAEHADLVEQLVSPMSLEHQDMARRALTEANRKHLRDQLLELVALAPDSVQSAIGDARAFAASATRTRHAYTHWTQRDRALAGGPLIGLTEKLALLVQAFFLKEIGFDDAYLADYIARDRTRERIAHWASAPEFS